MKYLKLALETDYIDLSNVTGPEAKTFEPNKASVILNSCLRKVDEVSGLPLNPSKQGRNVTFGEPTTYYVEKFEEEYNE